MTVDNIKPKPPWLKVKMPGGQEFLRVKGLLRELELHTVCEEARCPNLGECFSRGTATFLILGDQCTRNCKFCAVRAGTPLGVDTKEPERVARAARLLELRHVVITSVTRDDLADGGAEIYAAVIRRLQELLPGAAVEVLIPDFGGNIMALQKVLEAAPDILNHNLETILRLYPQVRPQADYHRSLELLQRAKTYNCRQTTKSGLMVGLGEEAEEVVEALKDLRAAGCDLLTLGQYLAPSKNHLPVARYYSPQEFERLKSRAQDLGFAHVEAAPLVRSSYHAEEQVKKSNI